MLISTFGFSQILIPKFTPNFEEKDLIAVENDSVDILSIKSNVFDSLIITKINHTNRRYTEKENNKNFLICFYSNQFYDYLVISSNIPNCQIQKEKDLVGVVFIDDTRIFVINQSKISMEDFFNKSKIRYYFPKYKYEDLLYDYPIWKYIYINGILIHICDD